jgi:hypothetical protein
MNTPLNILSLGAGVQSSTLLLMSCRGLLPKLDLAIFADTGWEPEAVYRHLDWIGDYAEDHGIPVHVVQRGNLREETVNSHTIGSRAASIPLRILNPDGTDGIVRRQCTSEYKVEPIEAYIKQEVLGLSRRGRWPHEHVIDQWFGISADEAVRMRSPKPREQWKRHVYPLCGVPDMMLGRTFNRAACVAWLAEHYPERSIPRSSCIGCPFHTNAEWRDLKYNRPDEWADAIEVDEAVRDGKGLTGQGFLHRSLKPLRVADLDDDPAQMSLGFHEECLGYCGN